MKEIYENLQIHILVNAAFLIQFNATF